MRRSAPVGAFLSCLWILAGVAAGLAAQPAASAPPTEQTEAYGAYDRDHLYFGFYVHTTRTDTATDRSRRS